MKKGIITNVFVLLFGFYAYSQGTLIDKHLEMVNEIQAEFQTFINEIKASVEQRGYSIRISFDNEMNSSELTSEATNLNIPDIYPIESIPEISYPFGFRIDPFTKKKAFHQGIDIVVPCNTDVLSSESGTVFKTAYDKVGGNYIIIDHHNHYKTYYGHLSSSLVRKGEKVSKGQVIGKSGNTGMSTGPHIHYQVFSNGKSIDPLLIIH